MGCNWEEPSHKIQLVVVDHRKKLAWIILKQTC